MKLSEKEKAARKAAFRAMSPAEKLEYIADYYKWPILLSLLAAIVLFSVAHRVLNRKEPVLYVAMAGVVVGEDLEEQLTGGYLREIGGSPKKQEVALYKDLYLSEDADVLNQEYAYASSMKLMGAIQARELDTALMNREAYDLLSARGYLADLSALLPESDPALYEALSPYLRENRVVLEDNSVEWQLGEAEEHRVVTEEAQNAVELTELPLFRADFSEPVYFTVIANSPKAEAAIRYLKYLAE